MLDADDFRGCLAGNLRAATRAVTRAYDQALRPYGVRITQIAVLAQLHRGGPMGLTTLAAAVGAERSGVARDVARLEAAGLLHTSVSPDDQRVKLVSLTGRGGEVLEACAPAWRAMQAEMAAVLGPALVAGLTSSAALVAETLADR